MKGELEGRELAPGAPDRVGVGLVPQHSREDASVRIETGVKTLNQDSGTRNFPMPAVVGGNQGNGTRGFTVAELTKVESVAPPLGSLQIPSVKDSTIGSYSVPSFRQDCQGRAMASLAEASMQGWSGNRATGAFPRFPGFMGEGQGHSGALDLTRVSHDITSGSLHVAGDKKEGQGGNVKMLSMAQQKGDSHSIGKVPLLQDGVTGSSSVMSTKRETPKSAPERNCMAPSKRLNQDGAGMKPLEAVIKRLKQDACAAVNTVSAVDTKRVTGNNSVASENLVAVKRNCQDDASRITGVTDVKRMRQDTPTDTTNVTPLVREIQSSVKEAISSENFKNQSWDTPTGAIGGGATEMQGQKSFSSTAADKTINHMNLSQDRPTSGEREEATEAKEQNRLSTPADDKRISHMNLSQDGPASAERGAGEGQKCVSAADIQKAAEGVGTGLAQIETTMVEKESSAICSKEDSGVKDCSEGNTSNPSALPPALPVMQEKKIDTLETFSAPLAETSRQAQSSESPLAPDKEKETPKTLDGSGAEETRSHNGSAVEACIKIETQDTSAGETSMAVKEEEQKEDIDKDKLVAPKQESEEKVERNQENSTVKDGETEGIEGLASGGEGKGVASDPPRSLAPKPEMVSTETQCDGGGIGPYPSGEDEYAFIGDEGVPGECLGACEPGRKPYKCCQCDTSFRTPYELSRHSRVHSGERPFQCRLCHRCFKRKDHVEVHMRRHVEDRRHICGLCGVCFVTSSCLLRHQRRTHQAPGPKLPGEGEEGEVEVDAGDPKGDGKDQPTSRDAQRNGRRNKKNKPDTTYRPGGKTVCIIKKRNLRQRSYSFVELEDDVECFESDEEDRIPFLKVQEQRREEEREEFGGQSGQLDHSLFPGSLFSSDGSLGHLLLLGEVSRLLSHSLIPGSLEVPDTQADNGPEAGQPWVLEPNENEADSDDSDCDPPLVACDVTFMEGEGEVTGLSQLDDNPPAEEAMPHNEEHKPKSLNGPCQATLKGELCQATPGAKEVQGGLHPLPPGEGRMARPQSCTGPPPSPAALGKTAVSTNKSPGTGVGAMGVPRTAWVVPTNNTKGKNTCDACRRRNEANRLAQMEKERQTQAAQEAQEGPKVVDIKAEEPEEPLKECPAKVETMKPPEAPPAIQPSAPLPPKPQKPRPTASKRGRKSSSAKKRRQNKTTAMAERAAAAAAAQRPHKCHLCPFAFRSATELKRHASTHSGERPFLCELCGAGFVRKCHLQLHVRRHSGERRHACPECRMRFFTPSDLARHQAIHQVGEKPLECHLCHLTFRRAFHLERHIRRHNDAAPFACKLCGAFFSSAAALRSHDKHHRTPGPHACPDCTAAFTTATALSRHRRVHSARHDRLLRAIERHATAKSSYECVSSEGSPLSLVIRKVAATTGASGEGGTAPAKDTTSDISSEPAHGGEEGEVRKADGSTPFANGEREESEKSASSQAITTAGSEEQSGGENISFGSPSTNKENPSITEQMKRESKNLTSMPLGSTKSIDESQNLNSILPTLDKINKDCEKIAYTEKEESARVTSMTSVLGKGLRTKGETNSSRFTEETLAAEDDPYVFKLTAAESQAEIKSGKSNTKRNKKSNEESFKFSSTNRGKEAFSKSLSSVHTTERDMEHIEPSGSKAINRTREHLEGSGNLTPCGPSKREEKVSSVELEGQPGCGLPAMSEGGQEAERGGTCSLLAPTRKETDSLKEIHCRTTYHLSEDPRSILHSGSGCTGEQEGSRSGPQDGQAGSVREGVATTS